MTMPDHQIVNPIPVNIQNWAPPVKPATIRRTTLKTQIIGTSGFVQICDFEPNRARLALFVVDSAVSISTAVPTTTPETSSNTTAPQGGVLFAGALPYEFFGPDPFWLNSLGGQTRVTIVKEYYNS